MSQNTSLRLLLIKATGDFKHSGKYMLLNGRWHALHADKPVPKNAPIAVVPHAAGQHLPATLTTEEVEALKYPADKAAANHEMKNWNEKHIPELLGHAANGDATAILGMTYGSNTHGKLKAKLANVLLDKMGSAHQVKPGQKAGEHAAVQQAPAANTAEKPVPADEKPKVGTGGQALNEAIEEPAKDDPAATFTALHEDIGTPSVMHDGKDWFVLGTGVADADGKVNAHLASKTEGFPQKNGYVPKQIAVSIDPALINDPKKESAAAATAKTGLSLPAFVDGKQATGVKAYYEHVGQKVLAMAAAGDSEGLEKLKANGLQPNKKGKVSNTWAGKTQNSKMLIDLHAKALEHANGGSPSSTQEPEPAHVEPIKKEPRLVLPTKARASAPVSPAGNSKLDAIQWDSIKLPDSNKNAKSHNKQVEKIKAMAMAGDVAGLEAFKAGTNTYGKAQNKLAQTALAALKDGGDPAVSPEPPASPKSLAGKPAYDHIAQQIKTGGFADTAAKEWMVANPGAWDEINAALTDNGYEHLATFGPKTAGVEAGPKEGDTKQGADGMLIFKDGRWHKQEKPLNDKAKAAIDSLSLAELQSLDGAPGLPPASSDYIKKKIEDASDPQANVVYQPSSAAEPFGLPAPPIFSDVGGNPQWAKNYATVAKELHDIAMAEGADSFKGIVVSHGDGRFTITLAGFKLKKVGPDDKPEYRKQMHAYVQALKSAVGKPKKSPKPKAAPSPQPAAAAPAIEAVDSWTQTGPQAGSNPGGRFKDTDGQEWYVKFPDDEDVAKSELLAAKLYGALGISGQDAKLITKNGKVGIASKWTSVSKAPSPAALAKTEGVASGFGADAWLGNWDVVGLGYDNLQIGADGKAHRVDAGGSLMYRAKGGKKAFGPQVTEIDSLRDKNINQQAAAVFGGLTEADITASVAKVISLPDASIRALSFQYGPGSEADRKALADTLIARKADLAAKFPKAAKPKKKRLDPNSLPVDASQLPKRHDFSNWNGPSKGLSSKEYVNAANSAVEQEALDLAKTGNLTKLKDFQFHEIDKDSGNATGKLIPIKNHPSKHVVQFHADLVQMLDEIANPPEPLKHFVEADVGTLDALAAAFPPKPFGTTVASVKSNEKLGFWVVLGGASGASKFKPKKVMDFTASAIQAAYQKYKDAKPLAKHFINSVQASGSYNDLFRNGKEEDGHGNKLVDVAKAALEQATSQPEGTSVYRWQNMSDDMVKKIMSAPDGTVFQATGPMCTSYSATLTSGFGQHRVTIRYANGAKGVESFGSGAFKGEKEVTTLPNSRFVILSKSMVPNEKNHGKQRLELEVLMLPPDLGIEH